MLPTLTLILTPLMNFLLLATLTRCISISRLNLIVIANMAGLLCLLATQFPAILRGEIMVADAGN